MQNYTFDNCTLLGVRGNDITIPDGIWDVYERQGALSYRIYVNGEEYDVSPDSFTKAKLAGTVK